MPVLEPVVHRSEVDALQGVWTTIAGPREARLLIAGNRFTFEFVTGELYMGTFSLAPGEMDMHVDAGPPEHIGKVSQCLIHLEGGVLRWCPGRPGSGRRPVAFPNIDDACNLSLVFRRANRRSTGHRPI